MDYSNPQSASPGFISIRPFQAPDTFSPYEYLMGVGQKAWANVVADNERYKPDLDKYDDALKAKMGELLSGRYESLNDQLYGLKSSINQGIQKYGGFAKAYFSSEDGMKTLSAMNDWYSAFNAGYREKKDYDEKQKKMSEEGIGSMPAVISGTSIADEKGNYVTNDQLFRMWENERPGTTSPRDFSYQGMGDKQFDELLKRSFDGIKTYEWTYDQSMPIGYESVNNLLNKNKAYANMNDAERYMAFTLSTGRKFWDNSDGWKYANKYFTSMAASNPDLKAMLVSKYNMQSPEMKQALKAEADAFNKKYKTNVSGFQYYGSKYLNDAAMKYLVSNQKDTKYGITQTALPDAYFRDKKDREMFSSSILWNAQRDQTGMKPTVGEVYVPPTGSGMTGYIHNIDPDKQYTEDEMKQLIALANAENVKANNREGVRAAGAVLSLGKTETFNELKKAKESYDDGDYLGALFNAYSAVNPILGTGKAIHRWATAGDSENINGYFEKHEQRDEEGRLIKTYYTAKDNLPIVNRVTSPVKRSIPIYTFGDESTGMLAMNEYEAKGKTLKQMGVDKAIINNMVQSIDPMLSKSGRVKMEKANTLDEAEIVDVGSTPFKSLKPRYLTSGNIDKTIKEKATDIYGNPKPVNQNEWTFYMPVKVKLKNASDLDYLYGPGEISAIKQKDANGLQNIAADKRSLAGLNSVEYGEDGEVYVWMHIPDPNPAARTNDKNRHDKMVQWYNDQYVQAQQEQLLRSATAKQGVAPVQQKFGSAIEK